MQIYGNENLVKYISEIDKLKEKFTEQMDIINNEYTPIYTELKKRRKNRIYLVGLMIAILIVLFYITYLGDLLKNYITITAYVITFVLLIIAFVLLFFTNKEYHEIIAEWDIKHKNVMIFKDQINEILNTVKDEVFKVICLTKYHDELEIALTETKTKYDRLYIKKLEKVKSDIYLELGETASNEDILNYYKNWGKQFTTNENYDEQQFLEARRRKAILMSQDKN